MPTADVVEGKQEERMKNVDLLRRAEALMPQDQSEMWAGGRAASRRPPVLA